MSFIVSKSRRALYLSQQKSHHIPVAMSHDLFILKERLKWNHMS